MSLGFKRIFGLDLVRCVAILLVLVTHTVSFVDPANHYYQLPVFTGFAGVELFFVLSGFLIGTLLLKIYSQPDPFNMQKVRTFWIRRWFRTLPNYYLMIFIYAVLFFGAHHVNILAHLKYLAYLVFLQNAVTYQPNDFFQIAWSLSIEEWFYLLFPLILLVMARLWPKAGISAFFSTILVFILAELLIRVAASAMLHRPWDEGFRKFMPFRLDSISIGVLAAYFKQLKPAYFTRYAKQLACFGLLVFAICCTFFYLLYIQHFDPITWDHSFDAGFFLKTLFFTLVSLSIASVIPWLYQLELKRSLFTRAVTFISEISYSIYLNHLLIILTLSHLLKRYLQLPHFGVVIFVCIWVTTIAVSAIQYNYCEVPVTNLRARFSKKQENIKVA
jgi:peptidoglycan/LPS O-acetylase OafA/YrhL